MQDNRYRDEIEKLEKEREELLNLLSNKEREEYEYFKKRFSETDHSRHIENEEKKNESANE